MPFITGSANSLSDVLTGIQNACTANGWTLNGQVLSKGPCYIQLAISGQDLQMLGGTGIDGSNNLTTPGPQPARLGATAVPAPLVFPLTYNIHIQTAPDEVYVFLNFSANCWQWLAFGCSPAVGLPGTGNWYSAISSTGSQTNGLYLTAINTGGFSSGACVSGALFAQYGSWVSGWCANSYFHHGLDGNQWSNPEGFQSYTVGDVDAWVNAIPMMGRLPNTWNGEAVLLPILPIARRPSNKVSLVGQLGHARYIRNDNLADGAIITLGSDRWKTYPWAQKNAAVRNGGGDITHSGTFGVALRYDGP